MLSPLLTDCRTALQRCRRRPRLVVMASLVMSLGIAWTTAMFAIGDALYLRPLPIRSPSRVFYIYAKTGASPTPMSGANAVFLRDRGGALADLCGLSIGVALVGPLGFAHAVFGETVSSNYFSLLGVPVAVGRPFAPEDTLPSSPEVVVIGYELWVRSFGADPAVIGRRLRIDTGRGADYMVIGVAPRDFRGLSGPFQPSQFWIPAKIDGPQIVVARLKDGVNPATFSSFVASSAEVATKLTKEGAMPGQLASPFANRPGRVGFVALPSVEVRIPSNPSAQVVPMLVLGGMVGVGALLLLVATFNASALALADAYARYPEVLTMTALGASKGRLFRQFAIWGVVVAIASWALGWLLALQCTRILGAALPAIVGTGLTIDSRTLVFAGSTSLLTGLIVAVVPVWSLWRQLGVNPPGRYPAAARGHRLKRGVVLPQVAVTIVCGSISAAWLHVLESRDIRPQEERTLAVTVTSQPATVKEGAASLEATIRRRLESTAGVDGVATTNQLPFLGFETVSSQRMSAPGAEDDHAVGVVQVSGDYFRLQHYELIGGRTIDAGEVKAARQVVVLTEGAAALFWQSTAVIGHRLIARGRSGTESEAEVVGVVKDPVHLLNGASRPVVFRPVPDAVTSETGGGRTTFVLVSGSGPVDVLERSVRRSLAEIQPPLSIVGVTTLAAMQRQILAPRRVAALVSLGLAAATQVLSLLTVYAVFAYVVTAQAREFAIRASLGAAPSRLLRDVQLEAVRLVAWAALPALPIVTAASLALSRLVRGVPLVSLSVFVGTLVVTAAIGLVATYWPARRAASAAPSGLLQDP